MLIHFRIELQTRQYSCSKRQAIFTYLVSFLPCTKHTLLKRAKNLVIEDVESKLKPAVRKYVYIFKPSVPRLISRQLSLFLQVAISSGESDWGADRTTRYIMPTIGRSQVSYWFSTQFFFYYYFSYYSSSCFIISIILKFKSWEVLRVLPLCVVRKGLFLSIWRRC